MHGIALAMVIIVFGTLAANAVFHKTVKTGDAKAPLTYVIKANADDCGCDED